MSYLDLPRIHFGGTFQASPSTLNNTPNNYDASNWTPELTELYWAPNNNGVFDFVNCKVSTIVGDDSKPCDDPLNGQTVFASYTNAPPKLVDLDPMQQNTSELWGLLLQVGDAGGPYVRGTFEPISFSGIWVNSQGKNTPHNSTSGSAVFQSSLSNLVWNVGASSVLAALQKMSPQRLSVSFVVNSHNNAPPTYLFNDQNFSVMVDKGVPKDVVDKLQVLSTYRMMIHPGHPQEDHPGLIPTSAWVNLQLLQLLGEQVAKQYGETILEATVQPYTPYPAYTPVYDFNHGQVVGTVGPAASDEPTYYVPSRVLVPAQPPPSSTSLQPPNYLGFFAPAKLRADASALTVDLGNSLPVELPGYPPWTEKLGKLSLAYESPAGSGTYHPILDDIPYDEASGLMTNRAGVLDVTGLSSDQVKALRSSPLVLLNTLPGEEPAVLLQENPQGMSLRADQFVFRMNPGVETTPSYPRGESATINVYVRKFGEVEGTEGLEVELHLMDKDDATEYTSNTSGTSGTAGIENLSVPPDVLQFDTMKAKVDANGVATFHVKASNPGNPRQYVDGQVYFVQYNLSDPIPVDVNNLLSFQVYEQVMVESPTWDNSIGAILGQFGYLYPVMAQFGLGEHASVKKNHEIIRNVLQLDMLDPLHMPVTRDLSESRRKLILQWMDAGMP